MGMLSVYLFIHFLVFSLFLVLYYQRNGTRAQDHNAQNNKIHVYYYISQLLIFFVSMCLGFTNYEWKQINLQSNTSFYSVHLELIMSLSFSGKRICGYWIRQSKSSIGLNFLGEAILFFNMNFHHFGAAAFETIIWMILIIGSNIVSDSHSPLVIYFNLYDSFNIWKTLSQFLRPLEVCIT